MDGGYNPYGSQGGGGGFVAGETNSPSGGKTSGDNKTLRPVTIKQINDAVSPYPEAPFQIDGADVANVLFVAQVRNISKQSTNITYKVDDSTGDVEVKKWVDSATADTMDMDDPSGIHTKGYVRVFGAIKSFGNKRYIGAHSIRPVSDINEFLCSMLDATAAHLFFTRGPPGTGGAAGAAGGGDATMGDYAAEGEKKTVIPGLSEFSKQVYRFMVAEPQDSSGVHVQTIAAKMGLPAMDIQRSLEELGATGILFSTTDDHTYAVLDYNLKV